MQDPADGVDSPFDGYFDYTGITSITPPAGADQVQIEWLDENGDWHVAYGPGPIPGDPSTIPDGVPFDDVKGMKFTFSSSTGAQLPPSGDQPAEIGIGAVTNDTVSSIPDEQSVRVCLIDDGRHFFREADPHLGQHFVHFRVPEDDAFGPHLVTDGEDMLERVRERTVSDIVQQRRREQQLPVAVIPLRILMELID